MRVSQFVYPLFLFVFTFNLNAAEPAPRAVKGVLDLRYIDRPDHFFIKLTGDWEFYWQKMLRPHDFKSASIKPDFYGKVPSYWIDYPQNSIKTGKSGYATYRLTVLLPHSFNRRLGIDLPVFDSSYDLYINEKYFGGNGTTGKSAEETEPEYRRNFYSISPQSDTLSIIINVSNYDHRRGGFWLPVKLGTFDDMQKHLANSWGRDWAVTSLLLGFSIFFFLFFLISPKEKIMCFFSISTLGLALRPLVTSHFLILSFFSMKWEWIVRFEYLDLFMIIIGSAWFASYLYPSRFLRTISWIITFVFSILSVSALFLPVKIFSYSTFIYYPCIIFLTSYLVYRSLLGSLKKNPIEIMYFFTFSLLFYGGLHDITIALGKSDSSSGYILTNAIVIFVFLQAVLLLFKWVRANNEKEKLKNELEFMNRNLELLVSQRTQELQFRNEEIENQNSRIALQNQQLSDTIHLKNRIFSLIAHDLRSPVVNILYMLNLLKEKEYKEKYDAFANSSIQYAQLVINLLENMLVWGRGQEDKIKYSPEKRNLADIILTNMSIFKESADNKDISLNFTQIGSSIAFIDKDLLDIIIRNLLSNAVKYTPRGGRISILLKDKIKSDDSIIMKICDNGVGIDEENLKNFFKSAEIESTPGTENEKGTGLGLKLCCELVKINNGTITVESKPGEGTCFIISLPSDNLSPELDRTVLPCQLS
ncbi:MAG: sensor histidine kinase [Bacteroidales bacterium]|nr:sensor histidine kinase [Bacteroidales bacterium]